MTINYQQITAVILAGGNSCRMHQQDKGLILLNQQPLIQYVIAAIQTKVSKILINANRNLSNYQKFGYQVIDDDMVDFQGPLAGFAKAMAVTTTPYLLILPCDCPLINGEIVDKLAVDLFANDAEISVAFDGERLQPTFVLLKTKLLSSLNKFLQSGNRKIDLWYQQHRMTKVLMSDYQQFFTNLNLPYDHARFAQASMVDGVPILGIAAFSGTGKTTLLTKVIHQLSQNNLDVAFIKHGHHNFEIDYPGKDSYECLHAGAKQVIIASNKKFAKIAKQQLGLFELLRQLDLTNIGLVLIEGFKQEKFSKIELQRRDLPNSALYLQDNNIIAIASDKSELLSADENCNRVLLDINNIDEICEFILAYISSKNLGFNKQH